MKNKPSHLAVHWIDGMKISRQHFEETQNHLEESIQDGNALQLTDYQFGILPTANSLEYKAFFDTQQKQVKIDLHACNAITPNGTRVQVVPEDGLQAELDLGEMLSPPGETQQLFIFVNIDPFKRIAIGEPKTNENPPRSPFTKPDIQISVVPSTQIQTNSLSSQIIIGAIDYANGKLARRQQFLPPCTSVSSLPDMLEWYHKFQGYLNALEQNCYKIIQKVNAKAKQQNALGLNVQKLSERLLAQLVGQKTHFRWVSIKSAPIFLGELLLRNIELIYATLQCYTEKDKEELLNYFGEWTNLPAGALEQQTIQVQQINYDHYDVEGIFSSIDQIYTAYGQVFEKLAQLDFIGKRKGQGVFVMEEKVKENKPSPSPNKKAARWSPLD
jgi:hypothetical protein